MPKLPNKALVTLKQVVAAGKLPEPEDSIYNEVFDVWGDLLSEFGGEWEKASASKARREVSALVDFWSAIPTDGLVIGIAVNQPGVVATAIDAAKSMKLASLVPLLEQIKKHIPSTVVAMSDVDKRMEWYESAKGESHAAQLGELEEVAQEQAEFGTAIMLGCFRRLTEEPGEFFEKS
jgi:hypothetical protein